MTQPAQNKNDAQQAHPKYRPDIDGLRTIAVLSVVVFHAFPSALPGGFIGVDIFFVISGYLISTILFNSLQDGRFQFRDFYARRVRRIFPALLLVLVATYALGWSSLLTAEFGQLGKHIAGGAGFVANLVFWSEAGYFDTAGETKPLLHLWSLGIEEQFYIVWPLLLWACWRARSSPRLLFGLTLALLAASFALCVWLTPSDPTAAFYAPYTRFWELLAGSALAWVAGRRRRDAPGAPQAPTWVSQPRGAGMMSWSGCALLLAGLVVISPATAFPGVWALLPVLGAVLVILAGPRAWLNRVVLSHPWMVAIGLISYPLYLWHWPLLSFARILNGGTPDAVIRLLAVVLAIALAALTYLWVERPIRRHLRPNVVNALVLLILMVGTGYAGYNAYARDGLPFRKVVALNPSMESGADGGDHGHSVPGCGPISAEVRTMFADCLHDGRGQPRYVLIGDSKAQSLYPGLVRTSAPEGRWMMLGGNGPLGGLVPLISDDPALAPVQTLARPAIEVLAANPDIEVVVMANAVRALFQLSDGVINGNVATYNPRYMEALAQVKDYDARLEALDRSVGVLLRAGKRVVLVEDNPALPNPQDCIARRSAWAPLNAIMGEGQPLCRLPLPRHLELTAKYRQLLQDIQQRHPQGVRVFHTTELLCDAEQAVCGPIHNGRLLYAYTDHISDYSAGRIGAALNEWLNAQ